MEITNGETLTDADGKFTIRFKAIPDLDLDKNFDPVFDYQVEADVTDVNGETRTGTTTVSAGYKSLNLQINLPASLPADSLKKIIVTTTNLNGEFSPTDLGLKIYKLDPPSRLIRNRYWREPDQFLMTKDEYIRNFPFDEYKDETKKETWPKSLVKTLNVTSTQGGEISLGKIDLAQGWYMVEVMAKDKDGKEVKNLAYIQLFDEVGKGMPAPAFQWDAALRAVAEPGQSAKFLNGSSASDIFLVQEVDKTSSDFSEEKKSQFSYFNLGNGKQKFEFPVTENDRGGFGVNQFFVKENRVYTTAWNVVVPWTNKQLDISFETFRDKTLPGSLEKWKVKILGKKGERVAAEMLASMYDASLDQFRPHSWDALNPWPYFSRYSNWQGSYNFADINSTERYVTDNYLEVKSKSYDRIIGIDDLRQLLNIRMAKPMSAEAKMANADMMEAQSAPAAAPPPIR